MRKMSKLLFAAGLLAIAFLAAPPKASADNPWCRQCAATSDCFSCCICDGGEVLECDILCSP
jgi:hypothetical protein